MFAVSDKNGKEMMKVDQERDAPEIDRTSLRQILLDSIPRERIKWGYGLKSASLDEDDRPVLKFSNGEVVSGFKLVVGADGGWSKVRSLVCFHPSHYQTSLNVPLAHSSKTQIYREKLPHLNHQSR